MKRILFLISIAFLVSCTNTPNEENTNDVQDEKDTKPGHSLADSVPEIDENVKVLHPGGQELELDIQDGGGYMDQEIAQLFRQATSAYDQEDFSTGVRLFNEIIEKTPDDGRAYYNLGIGYFKLNKYIESIQAFTGAMDINPNDSLAMQYRGKVYYIIGDFNNCLRDYERVVELKPNDPVAYFNRGTIRGRINNYSGAIEDFNKAIELNPEYNEAYFNRGIANFHLGRMHDACYDWRKAHTLGHYEADKAIKAYCEGEKK